MADKIKIAFVNENKSCSITESDMDYEIEVDCEIVDGCFAIHKLWLYDRETSTHLESSKLTVTHIPTGCRIATPNVGTFDLPEQARAFIERIKPFARWPDITQESIRANPERWTELGRKVKSAHRAVTG